MKSDHATVQTDWSNREFVETVQQNILQIVSFLNKFDLSTRYRLAKVNEKLTKLERHLDFLDASIANCNPRSRTPAQEQKDISVDVKPSTFVKEPVPPQHITVPPQHNINVPPQHITTPPKENLPSHSKGIEAPPPSVPQITEEQNPQKSIMTEEEKKQAQLIRMREQNKKNLLRDKERAERKKKSKASGENKSPIANDPSSKQSSQSDVNASLAPPSIPPIPKIKSDPQVNGSNSPSFGAQNPVCPPTAPPSFGGPPRTPPVVPQNSGEDSVRSAAYPINAQNVPPPISSFSDEPENQHEVLPPTRSPPPHQIPPRRPPSNSNTLPVQQLDDYQETQSQVPPVPCPPSIPNVPKIVSDPQADFGVPPPSPPAIRTIPPPISSSDDQNGVPQTKSPPSAKIHPPERPSLSRPPPGRPSQTRPPPNPVSVQQSDDDQTSQFPVASDPYQSEIKPTPAPPSISSVPKIICDPPLSAPSTGPPSQISISDEESAHVSECSSGIDPSPASSPPLSPKRSQTQPPVSGQYLDIDDKKPQKPKKSKSGKKKKRSSRQKLGPNGEIAVRTICEGDGESFPQPKSLVYVYYVGWLQDGTKFDASQGEYEIQLSSGTVVEGLEIVLLAMSVGQKVTARIPAALAYGESGAGDLIPGNCDLKFELELVRIED